MWPIQFQVLSPPRAGSGEIYRLSSSPTQCTTVGSFCYSKTYELRLTHTATILGQLSARLGLNAKTNTIIICLSVSNLCMLSFLSAVNPQEYELEGSLLLRVGGLSVVASSYTAHASVFFIRLSSSYVCLLHTSATSDLFL